QHQLVRIPGHCPALRLPLKNQPLDRSQNYVALLLQFFAQSAWSRRRVANLVEKEIELPFVPPAFNQPCDQQCETVCRRPCRCLKCLEACHSGIELSRDDLPVKGLLAWKVPISQSVTDFRFFGNVIHRGREALARKRNSRCIQEFGALSGQRIIDLC